MGVLIKETSLFSMQHQFGKDNEHILQILRSYQGCSI